MPPHSTKSISLWIYLTKFVGIVSYSQPPDILYNKFIVKKNFSSAADYFGNTENEKFKRSYCCKAS